MSERSLIRADCPASVQGEKASGTFPQKKYRLPIVRLLPWPSESSSEEPSASFIHASQTPFPDIPLTPGSVPPATPHPEIPSTPEPEIPATPRNTIVPVTSSGVFEVVAIKNFLRAGLGLREGWIELGKDNTSQEDRRSELCSALISLLLVAILALLISYFLSGR